MNPKVDKFVSIMCERPLYPNPVTHGYTRIHIKSLVVVTQLHCHITLCAHYNNNTNNTLQHHPHHNTLNNEPYNNQVTCDMSIPLNKQGIIVLLHGINVYLNHIIMC